MEVTDSNCVCGRLWEPEEFFCAGCGRAKGDRSEGPKRGAPEPRRPTKRDRRGSFREDEDWAVRREDRSGRRTPPPPEPEGLKCRCGKLWVPPAATCECGLPMFSRAPAELDDERAAEEEAEAARAQLQAAERQRRAAGEARRAAEKVLANPSLANSRVMAPFSNSSRSPFPPSQSAAFGRDPRSVNPSHDSSLSNHPSRAIRDRSDNYDRFPRSSPSRDEEPRRSPETGLLNHPTPLLDRGGNAFQADDQLRPGSDRYGRPQPHRGYEGLQRNDDRFYDRPSEPQPMQSQSQEQPQRGGPGERPSQSQQYDRQAPQPAQRNGGMQRLVPTYDRSFNERPAQNQLQNFNEQQSSERPISSYGQGQGLLSQQPTHQYSDRQSFSQAHSTQFPQQSVQRGQYGQLPVQQGQIQQGLVQPQSQFQQSQFQQQSQPRGQPQQAQPQLQQPQGQPHLPQSHGQQQYGQAQNTYADNLPAAVADVWADLPVYPA